MRFDPQTRTAISATLHCLTGCAVGEVLGLALATWWGWSNGASIALAVALAFLFGYSFTVVPVLRTGMPLRRAIAVALAADTVSILTMEVLDNATVLAIPGAMDAGLGDALFWTSLALSLAIAFVLTVPVNRWLIARGRGHAHVHGLHGADAHAGHAEQVHELPLDHHPAEAEAVDPTTDRAHEHAAHDQHVAHDQHAAHQESAHRAHHSSV